jgi:hypothetical protein
MSAAFAAEVLILQFSQTLQPVAFFLAQRKIKIHRLKPVLINPAQS